MNTRERAREELIPTEFESDRLEYAGVISERVTLGEIRDLYAAVEHPDEVFYQTSWGKLATPDDAVDYLARRSDLWYEGRIAEYLIYEKDGADTAIGICCLRFDESITSCTLGIWLRKPYWGNEYAVERAHACIEVAFEQIGVQQVRVGFFEGNHKSRRSIEKYVGEHGGQYDGTTSYTRGQSNSFDASEGRGCIPHHEYAITREQYESDGGEITTPIPGVSYDDVAFDG